VTDQFQHVMVLTSIIIGLGITYILIGVGSIIERLSGHGARLRLSWAHGIWVAFLFVWMMSFWWWEFRLLLLLKTWTLGHYFFIVIYAVPLSPRCDFDSQRLGDHRIIGRVFPLEATLVLPGLFDGDSGGRDRFPP
jgi:hypothetical protein